MSESTVSHVLNETRSVRTTTAERVNQAIRTLGYSPNTIARSLARSSTMSIGVALSDIANHYFSGIVHGIESATSAQGYMLLLANTMAQPAEEIGRRAVDLLVQRINEPDHPPRVVRMRGQLRVRESCGTGLTQPQR